MSDRSAEFFHQHGYLVLRDVFAPEQLADLRHAAQTLRDRVEAAPMAGLRLWQAGQEANDRPDPELARACSWGIGEITRRELFDPILVDALATPRIDSLLNQLLYRPRAWGLKLLWAPRERAYDLHWHRDCKPRYDALMPYRPPRNDHVQFNAALEPDRSFIVVPGSHRRLATADEQAALDAQASGDLPGAIRVELDPGDIVFMDALAIHRGQAEPAAPRLSLHFSCQAHWVPLRPWGEAGNIDWLTSDAFLGRLQPATRPYYERLVIAPPLTDDEDPYRWLEEAVGERVLSLES